MGDYGSYTLLNLRTLNETSGNLQEDLAVMSSRDEQAGLGESDYVHIEFEPVDPNSDELPF